MKIFNLTLTVLMLFILSCKNENKQDIKPDTVLEDVSLLDTLQLKLNAGERWLANSETQEGVNKMDSLIEVFDTNTDKDFKKLGEGYLVSRKTISYNIYRAVLREAGNMMGVRFTVRVNPEIAELLCGEENTLIGHLEKKIGKRVAIYPNPKFHMEEFDILESMEP